MNKLILFFPFIFPFLLSAENDYFKKGDWLLGGGATSNLFISERIGLNKFTNFNLDVFPAAGYFVTPRMVAGLNTHAGIFMQFRESGNYQILTLGAGPFARYYLNQDKLSFFATGITSFLMHKRFNTVFRPNNLEQNYSAGPGLSYFIASNVAIEGLLLYNRRINRPLGDYSVPSIPDPPAPQKSGNLQFNAGLQIFFSK
jgi:hypothetical protein